MSSSTMPPPPAPLAHRRTSRLITKHLPSSPPYSPDLSSCVPRKMSLSKGATFHHSSSPASEDDPVLSIPHLQRRSPTCSQAILASWVSDKQDIAQSLADFDHTFSGARGKSLSSRRRSAQVFEQQLSVHRTLLPLDEGLGSSISSPSEKGLATTFERALDLLSDKDSGLGSSITSVGDSVKRVARVLGPTPEDDGLARDLIQDANSSARGSPHARQQGSHHPPRTSKSATSSAVIHSIAPPPTRRTARHPPLSGFARKKIAQHILGPILREERFEDLHPLVTSLGRRSNKSIRCLRDLEQSLIFQPLTLALSQHLYRAFGEFSVQLVIDTYQQLSETEQRRASDRPYDNGYFLDLVQQVGRLAAHIGSSRSVLQSGTAEEEDDSTPSADDEVTLEGGLSETGNLAELVRWRNGKGISLRTGMPFEPVPGVKRQSSGALDEDVARSMARRKKGYIPELVEMECSDPTCDKVFNRKCDLAKHEKTHSRPFKCPEKTCKYHELGLPTEKERDRHVNDKHASNPKFYECEFCEFKTKRDSNCKQHMEKKHNWVYERAKGKDKATRSTPAHTPQTPAMEYSPSVHSEVNSYQSAAWEDESAFTGSNMGSAQHTPFDQPMASFETGGQPTLYSNPIFPRQQAPAAQNMPYLQTANFSYGSFNQTYQSPQPYISPANTTPMTPNVMGTPVTPAYSNITGQSPHLMNLGMAADGDCYNPNFYNTSLPTPESFLQPNSRNPSISHQSPMAQDSSHNAFMNDPMIGQTMPYDTDFTLFGTEYNGAFSNPAAANATLFPATEFEKLDNDPLFNYVHLDGYEDNDYVMGT